MNLVKSMLFASRSLYFERTEMGVRALVLLAVAALMACGCMAHRKDVVHEDWVQVGRVNSGEIEIVLAIRQTNTEWLEEKLWAVSYPDSSDYANYMNFDEIAAVVHGRPVSVEAVLTTLASVGVGPDMVDFTLGRDFAVVVAPLKAVESLFSAEFYLYEHLQDSNRKIVKSLSHMIPPSLEDHLDFVSGISNFPRPNRVAPKKQANYTLTNLGVDPSTIARDYNISYICSDPENSQAVAAFLKQYFKPDDLSKFQHLYSVTTNPIAKVEGENNPDDPGIEADLDVEYITATGRNATTWFISISRTANKGQEDFLYWIMEQVNDTTSPWVHSVSYGDYEVSIPIDYQNRTDNEFMKFGISGRSVLFASGDEGVHCRKGKYVPEWPTCSPYVTSVGGTVSLTEVWSDGGGGFSETFPMPEYQRAVVEAYLASGKAPPTKYFNKSGRAYPDVSAFSVEFNVIYNDQNIIVGGTSCATPTFAGIITSLNDIRLQSGKKTLGFINPLLYQTLQGKGFFDITQGSNPGVGGCPGFDAIEGWDPASGWGSPNFGILRDLIADF